MPVLAFLLAYSYTKRFTALAHFWLGASLMLAPVSVWIALRGSILMMEPLDIFPAVLLGLAVLLWVAGFDIIYACQDLEFDQREGLHSIPAKLGAARALMLSRLMHVAMVGLLLWLWSLSGLGWIALAGVAVTAALLGWEHSLVSADDFSKVDAAFFQVNGIVGVLFFLFWAADMGARGF